VEVKVLYPILSGKRKDVAARRSLKEAWTRGELMAKQCDKLVDGTRHSPHARRLTLTALHGKTQGPEGTSGPRLNPGFFKQPLTRPQADGE
jgi:hypothetical protein